MTTLSLQILYGRSGSFWARNLQAAGQELWAAL